MTQESTSTAAYAAARKAAAVARMDGWGWLRLIGRDRLNFMQRLTTNDFRSLPAGTGKPTVLTSPTGRVLAFLVVFADTDTVYVRTEPNQAPWVARHLEKLIFWNDELEVHDASGEVAQWGLYGPRALELLGRAAREDALAGIAHHGWMRGELNGVAIQVQRGGPLALPDWTIVAGLSDAKSVQEVLLEAAPLLSVAELEQLRVEAGIPAWGHELSDQVTPLEAGLKGAISFNKGCYTGQEVIARQANYDKIPRQLAGLVIDDLDPAELPALSGATVRAAGRGRPGFIGSVVWSPTLDQAVALAVVPKDVSAPATRVEVEWNGRIGTATVAALPLVAWPGV